MTLHRPTTSAELAAIVAEARAARTPLAIGGGLTRSGLGRPVQAAAEISTRGLTGITLYEPAELVIAARAGTPLREVTEALAAKGQRLPFEPMDHRRLYGTTGEPTVGGVAAGNVSGPARINLGAARDSMIGLKFVNGRGEDIKSGGRVMKNVTGLDLVKALAGSHGTLGIFHEICFKVLPVAESEATLQLGGLTDIQAIEALSTALGSPFEPTGAAHLPAGGGEAARTLLRIEGFAPSIAYRSGELAKLLKRFGMLETIAQDQAAALWRDIRDAALYAGSGTAVWRISVAPSKAAALGAKLAGRGARLFYDWGGGLIWAAVEPAGDAEASFVHAQAKAAGGHATLVRAPDAVRLAVDVFDPPAPPLMAMQKKLKASLDPDGILNPGRMYAGV
ncbi:FAD-binding protein [Phreatobacter stygius]|uniref:FAD-binding protein n=1 Tax=Phreatobacter stygius TaxID=1940610 RepID=A0A4D7B5I9_9HYPH|nr:FAD-binding protein [Phreatobacter stygius]QCI65678.1 FAD-binding protein [Phreatobacter stygius]